jgi:hypothetical protein
MPEILATQGAEVGRLWSEPNLGKSERPYLKNKLKNKKTGDGGGGSSGRVFA